KQGFLVESINRLETIKALGVEGRMQYKWDQVVDSSARSSARERRMANLFNLLSVGLSQISYVSVVIMGVHLAMAGEMTMGGLIACAILNGRAMAPLLQLSRLFTRLQTVRVSLGALNQLMSQPEEAPPESQRLHMETFRGELEFRSVFFRYPSQNEALLKNISFHIKPGERVGIIGPFGSGKSSLFKLLMGFYASQGGSVLVDGTDVQQMEPSELRGAMAYVSQDNALFTGTIRENVALGLPHLEDQKIMTALSYTGYAQAILHHPLGLDRPVGDQGYRLSGGERQAICLARALVRPNSILLLDEPSSAMDPNAELVLMNSLNRITRGQTMMIISQRVRFLTLVDRILVMNKDGHIIDDGPRTEMVQKYAAPTRQPPQKGISA
ncbi:MAG: ATP-binding cassette domain-containing protein, partial [Magnetococcales bacterium]|nr:ATP-binding cassette domain-containing protein [Magnetococcales bacterium]